MWSPVSRGAELCLQTPRRDNQRGPCSPTSAGTPCPKPQGLHGPGESRAATVGGRAVVAALKASTSSECFRFSRRGHGTERLLQLERKSEVNRLQLPKPTREEQSQQVPATGSPRRRRVEGCDHGKAADVGGGQTVKDCRQDPRSSVSLTDAGP